MDSRALFDDHWSQTGADGLTDPADRRRIAAIAALCPRVDRVLDVGCGNGDVLRALHGKARLRVGCDASAPGVAALLRAPGSLAIDPFVPVWSSKVGESGPCAAVGPCMMTRRLPEATNLWRLHLPGAQ